MTVGRHAGYIDWSVFLEQEAGGSWGYVITGIFDYALEHVHHGS